MTPNEYFLDVKILRRKKIILITTNLCKFLVNIFNIATNYFVILGITVNMHKLSHVLSTLNLSTILV